MTLPDIFMVVLALLLYSGPLLPLLPPLLFRRASHERFRRNVTILLITTALQALAFLPFILAFAGDAPEAEQALAYPALLGMLMFLTTSIYAIVECIHLRSLIRSCHSANH